MNEAINKYKKLEYEFLLEEWDFKQTRQIQCKIYAVSENSETMVQSGEKTTFAKLLNFWKSFRIELEL